MEYLTRTYFRASLFRELKKIAKLTDSRENNPREIYTREIRTLTLRNVHNQTSESINAILTQNPLNTIFQEKKKSSRTSPNS